MELRGWVILRRVFFFEVYFYVGFFVLRFLGRRGMVLGGVDYRLVNIIVGFF